MAAYLALVLAVLFYKANITTNVKRAGWIALSQEPVAFALGTKNNIVGLLIGKGYERVCVPVVLFPSYHHLPSLRGLVRSIGFTAWLGNLCSFALSLILLDIVRVLHLIRSRAQLTTPITQWLNGRKQVPWKKIWAKASSDGV